MAIQDTSTAILETAAHTQKNVTSLLDNATSKTLGMHQYYCL
jgi:hypothetical protein